MTPSQLKKSSTKDLIVAYKNKARSIHSESKTVSIWNELLKRLGRAALNDLRIAHFHLKKGEGDSEFNEECDKLINLYCK